MLHSGNDNNSSAAPEECSNMEFRSYADDGWYNVQVVLEGERGDNLRVKYDNFPDDHNHVFRAESFKSKAELYHFIFERFRKVSAQLQDSDCHTVIKGIHVCASHSFGDDDLRFYDAIVEDVLHKKHSKVNGQEECECTFLLFWLHGPNVGKVAEKRVADVCLVQRQGSELQPKLASFMEIAMEKIEKNSCSDLALSLVNQHREENGLIVKQEPSFTGSLYQIKSARQSSSEGGTKAHSENGQDTDIGGYRMCFIILVQNLEKGLSPSKVLEFIHEQTSIAPQVYIFSTLPWETYANAIIMLDSKENLEQLFGFLQNPNHFIVSLNGRPWVATEKMLMNDHWISMLECPKNRGCGFSNQLKVVFSGTEEYEIAKEAKDLFLQFSGHQKGLYETLRKEERRILRRIL